MNDHLDIETISAYLDEEVPPTRRVQVEHHLAECTRCASEMRSLQAVASAVGQLPREEITVDEHRALRQALLKARTRPFARWSLLPLQRWWALAGSLGVVLIAVVGFVALRPSADRTLDQAAAPESAPQSLDFTSDRQIEAAVIALPEVAGGSGRTSGGAAISRGAEGGDGGGAPMQPPAPAGTQAVRGSSTSDSGAGADADGGGTPEQGETYAGARVESEGQDFSPQSGTLCLEKVRESGPPHLVPLVAKEARFKGRPAWLLVYALGPEGSPNGDRAQPRERIQVWLVAPGDCLDYSGATLLDRALYHSTFDRP